MFLKQLIASGPPGEFHILVAEALDMLQERHTHEHFSLETTLETLHLGN